MSDITEVLNQEAIADSILSDDNIVGSHRADSLAESVEQFQESQGPSENEQRVADLHTDHEDTSQIVAKQSERFVTEEEAAQLRAQHEAEQLQAQPEQQADLTPEMVQQGIEALDAAIQQYELNDPVSAKAFADDFCQAFGTDIYQSGANVEALGSVMAKTALSAVNIFDSVQGDLSKLPAQIPPASAKAFAYDFLKSWGVDPRTYLVDEQRLAGTVLGGVLNFMDTYNRLGGKVTSLEQLNSPEAAEYFFGNFMAALGVEAPIDRATALKLADAGGKYLLSFMTKLGQIQPQGRQGQGGRANTGRGRSNSGQRQAARANRFRTNADIFDPEVLERLELEKATHRKDESFAPKSRRQSSRFETNADIFSEDVMGEYDLRRL